MRDSLTYLWRGPTAAFLIRSLVPSIVDVSLFVVLVRNAGLPLVLADLFAIIVASAVSYAVHRAAADRANPYSKWADEPIGFALVASVSAAVDLAVLSLASVMLRVPTIGGLVVMKMLALSAAAVTRLVGYRVVLAGLVRENRRLRPRPLEARPVRLSVVVPAFREPRIAEAVEAIRRELADVQAAGGVEVIVVDDGSGDGTAGAARAVPGVQVVELPVHRGKGAAVRAGVLAARGSVICFTDADLAYHPRHLRVLLEAVEAGWDVVIGDRRHPDSSVSRQSPMRAAGSRAVNKISALVLLDAPLDTQCGLKGFRSDVAQTIFGCTRLDGFSFDIEVLHLVERGGWSLHEIPVDLDELGGTSTVRLLRDTLRLVVDLLVIRRWSTVGGYQSISAGSESAVAGSPPSAG